VLREPQVEISGTARQEASRSPQKQEGHLAQPCPAVSPDLALLCVSGEAGGRFRHELCAAEGVVWEFARCADAAASGADALSQETGLKKMQANLQTEEVLAGAYVSSDEVDVKGNGRANARAV
jgi:hypothetical protein